MMKVIDSEVVLKAYFNKHQAEKQIKYADLKRIRYSAEPHVNAYIDVTYSSLRRVQIIHQGAIAMDNVQITIVGESFREIKASEQNDVKLIEQYL